MLKRVFRLTLRAAQGFIDSIFTLMKLPLRCPDYSCVSRRAKSVCTPFKNPTRGTFMVAWKQAGFRVVGHMVFTKPYASKSAFVGYQHECAYILAKGRPALPAQPRSDVQPWEYTGNRHHPTEKPVSILQPLIESFMVRNPQKI
ncbi:hypothetical protein SESI111939_11915 [Serratia silvae]